MKEIKKLAIANRGEVAVRIIRAAQELGIETVLLHSQADIKSRAYRLSDEQVCIGPSEVNQSYLSIENNIAGLLASEADAVHPGFGFLSENGDFAEAVEKNGVTFVGPKADSIRKMGDKIEAKKIIEKAGIPTVPGYSGDKQDLSTLVVECKKIGFPVIVKAAAGGGGRGMKVVNSEADAEEQIESAKREAKSAFGSEKVFLEKYLDRAKHIEVQVFGDLSGHAVHLFERECSVQRRHQKIIEEAVSPSIDHDLRKKLTGAAVTLAKAVKYIGAGTVEFLVQDGDFYFLEMNTRLQVEHPVTEMVLGIDLVKAQILTMMNRFSLWDQDVLVPRGHAIECRIYAEDPYTPGIPSTGKLGTQEWPWGPGRRFDFGFEPNDEVTSYYDSMISKIIVWDENRSRALMKLNRVLDETIVFGLKTNIPLLKQIINHPEFVDGSFTTQFMNNHFPQGAFEESLSDEEQSFAELAFAQINEAPGAEASQGSSPWQSGWRNI